MRRFSPARRGWVSRYLALGALVLALPMSACEGLLDVEDPANLTADDFEESIPVSMVTSGIQGAFQGMLGYYILYTGMLTDEFILAGTFPYRAEVDDRRVFDNNSGILGSVYNPLSVSRFMADTGVVMLENAIGGGGGVTDAELREAIAVGKYYGGFSRLLLAESFCASAIGGGPALSSDARMADALTFFVTVEAEAQANGQSDLVSAAQVGQARAHLWLRDFSAAASVASQVPADFEYLAYYSNSSIGQKNQIARQTWAINAVIRWTVGDGTWVGANNEKWPYFDEWVALGLIAPEPGLISFNINVPVTQQKKYQTGDVPIVIASGAEAELIVAEDRLRASDLAGAELIVNALRQDNWSLAPIAFTGGDLVGNLTIMARERARELYITGERLPTLRRYLEDSLDLFPVQTGTDTCFPVPLREKEANDNIG